MNASSRHAPRLLTGVVLAVVAVGYAWNTRLISPTVHGFAFFFELVSSERFLTTAALPVWLIAAAAATARESRPQRLVRHGSRLTLLSAPLWRLLGGHLSMSAVILATWWAVDLATGGGFANGREALAAAGVAAGAVAYLGVSFSIIYGVLLTVRLITDSSRVVAAVAVALWVSAEVSRDGWIAAPNPLNLPQYLTFESAIARPTVFAWLLLAGCLVWTMTAATARWCDAGRRRPHARRATVAGVVVALVAVVTVAARPVPDSHPGALSIVFVGPGSSLIDYLSGMTILLALAIAATNRFAVDWVGRTPLIRVRFGTTGRWVRRTLRREGAIVAGALLSVAVLVGIVRYAATGVNPVPEPGHDILLLFRLVITAWLVIVVLTASIVVTGSQVAPVVAAAVILVLGAVPALSVVGNPLTAWSAWWRGPSAVGAAVSAVVAVVAISCALDVYIRISKESKVRRVAH